MKADVIVKEQGDLRNGRITIREEVRYELELPETGWAMAMWTEAKEWGPCEHMPKVDRVVDLTGKVRNRRTFWCAGTGGRLNAVQFVTEV